MNELNPTTQYAWRELLGAGAMGRVFAGEQVATGREVVLKVPISGRHDAPQQFQREAIAAASIRHPDIVNMIDYGVSSQALEIDGATISAGTPYVVMERARGEALTPEVAKQLGDPHDIVCRVLGALGEVHAAGVVHRDIKPSNILARPAYGDMTIIDFGLSSAPALELLATRGGTLTTFAPEQVMRAHEYGQGPWTDIYALGCLLCWWLTHTWPFTGMTAHTVLEMKSRGITPEAIARLPAAVRSWVSRALAPDPRDRFATAAHAAAAFPRTLSWADDETPTALDGAATTPSSSLWRSSSLFDVVVQPPIVSHAASETIDARVESRPAPDLLRAPDLQPRANPGLGVFGWRRPPVIGRELEQAALVEHAIDTIQLRRPRFVGISGAPGVGKTHLCTWLTRRMRARQGAEVLSLTLSPSADQSAEIAHAISSWAGLHDGLGARLRRARLLQRARAVGVSLEEARALEALVFPTAAIAVDPAHTFAALVRAIARQRAVVVHLDCAEVDPELFATWRTAWANEPVLTLITSRATSGDAASSCLDELITLGALGADAHRALISSLLDVSEETADQLGVRAHGNPLFTIELLRSWARRRELSYAADGRCVLEPDAALVVPAEIYDLCVDRFGALLRDEQVGPMLCVLSTLGQRVSEDELIAWSSDDGALARQLVELDLLEPAPLGWAFTHNMLVETLHRWRDERGLTRACHRRAADIIGATSAGNARGWRRIARHREASGELDLMLRAARKLLPTMPAGDAHGWVDALEARHRGATDERVVAMLALARVAILQGEGRWSEIDAVLSKLEAEHDLDRWPEVKRWELYIRADTAVSTGAFADAERWLARWRELLRGQDQALEEHTAARVRANMLEATGDYQGALTELERAASFVNPGSWDHAWTLYQRSAAHEHLGQIAASDRDCRAALEFFEEHDDLVGRASCVSQLGSIALGQDQWRAAYEHFEDATRLYERCGDAARWLAGENALRARFKIDDSALTERERARLDEIHGALASGRAFLSFILDLEILAASTSGDRARLRSCEERARALDPEAWMYDPYTFAPEFLARSSSTLRARGFDDDAAWVEALIARFERSVGGDT